MLFCYSLPWCTVSELNDFLLFSLYDSKIQLLILITIHRFYGFSSYFEMMRSIPDLLKTMKHLNLLNPESKLLSKLQLAKSRPPRSFYISNLASCSIFSVNPSKKLS